MGSLTGFFDDETARPTLPGRVFAPHINFLGDVQFVVDTGADVTVLAPHDGLLFGADYARLGAASMRGMGMGGPTSGFVVEARLAFHDDDGLIVHVYDISLHLLAPAPHLVGLPSVLGRDVLDRWRMTYDPAVSELSFAVHSADDTIAATD